MSTTAQPSPLLITSGDLISQEEQFIKEYAAYFKLPTDLNRSKLLEKICQLHPGSTPSIPILPHLTFERVNGGKIRFTGRVSASQAHHLATRPAPTRPAVPANRRLVRQSNLLQAMIEAEQRVVPAREQEPSSRENTPSPETLVDVTPPPQASAKEEPLEDPFNMEHKVNIVLRFPTPVDEFDSPPPRRAHRSGSSDSAASSLPEIPPKRRMRFVYPPVPRTPTDPEQALPGVPRAFSPGDTWVEKMYLDLTRGRRDVKNDLEEVKREVRDATEEVLKAQIEFKREMQSTQDFLDYLKQIASEEWTDEILKYAGRIAEQGSSDSEDFDEADDHSSSEDRGVDDDGDEASDHGDSGGDDGDDDGRDTHDDSEVGERSDDRQEGVGGDEGSDNSAGSPSQVPPLCPSHMGKVFFSPCNHAVSLDEITGLRSRSSSEDSPSSPPVRTTTDDAGTRNSARVTLNLKRDRDDDSDDGRNTGELSPSSQRAKSSHDAPSNLGNKPAPHAVLPDQATHSQSRKRSRDDEDDNQSSELEVESSIRRPASEGSSGSLDDHQGSRKKARSNDHADAEPRSPSRANSTPSPASSPRPRPTNDPPVGGSDSSSGGSGDDEEPGENGWPAGLFGSRGVYDGASEDDEDADSIDGSAPSPGWNSVGAFSPPPGGPRFSYPPSRNPSESQPIAGPSSPRRTTRPLRRDTERLRETSDGKVEVYNYEKDLQWRRGMRLQRLAVQAHQAHPSYGAALSPEMDFDGLRLPTGWGVELG